MIAPAQLIHDTSSSDGTTARRSGVSRNIFASWNAQRIKAHESVLKSNDQLEQVAGIRRAALAALEVTDFDLIDINKHQGEIAALRAEQKALEESKRCR